MENAHRPAASSERIVPSSAPAADAGRAGLEALAAGGPGGAFWLDAPAFGGRPAGFAAFVAEAEAQGLLVVRGMCHSGGGVPYAPFLEALRSLLPVAQAEAPEVLASVAPALRSLLPSVSRQAPPALSPAAERSRLMAAVVTLVVAIAERRPTVMALEECQEADPLSLTLLAHLARAAGQAPLLLAVASRGLGETVGTGLAGITPLAVPAEAASAAPRLETLSASALVVARMASLAGPELDEPLLRQATGQALRPALDELQRAGLVAGLEAERVVIAPEARAAVLASTPEATRAEGHRALALALETRLAATPAHQHPIEALTALAWHALAGELGERATAHAVAAGARHAALVAHDTAEALLGTAIERLRGEGPSALRLEALAQLGDVHRVCGRFEAARALYDEAMPLADALGARTTASRMWTGLAQAHQGLDEMGEALACTERALAAAAGDPACTSRALLTQARLRLYGGELAAARAALEAALEAARAADDAGRVGEALAFLGYVLVAAGEQDADAGVRHLHEAIAVQTALQDQVGLLVTTMVLGNAELQQGAYMAAQRSFSQARELAETIGNRTEYGIALVNLAVVALALGEPAVALARAGEARANARAIGHQFQQALAEGYAAAAHLALGRLADAARAVESTLAMARALDNRYLDALVGPECAEVLLELGAPDRALALLSALATTVRQGGNAEIASRVSSLTALAHLRRGALGAATEEAARGLAMARASRARGDELRSLIVLARVAIATGEPALPAAESALALAESLGARLAVAEAHGLLATLHPAAAERHLAAMAATAAQAGALWLQAQALGRMNSRSPKGVKELQTLMMRVFEGLPADSREAFFGYAERGALAEAIGTSASAREPD